MAKFIPLHNNVIIKRAKTEEKTLGGLIIPGSATEKSCEAEVLAVGPGRITQEGKLIPIDVKPGDVVLLERRIRSELKIEGDDITIVSENDIIGVIQR